MHKKGVVLGDVLKTIAYSLVMVFILLSTKFAVSNVVDVDVDKEELLTQTYGFRSLFSKTCLAYTDVRSHPGIIDLNKFNSIIIDGCMGRDTFSAKYTLTYDGTSAIAYKDEAFYTYQEPLCFAEQYDCETFVLPNALVYDRGKYHTGTLEIDMIFGERKI